jgi:plastocyanin domain-containing protein
MFKSIVLTATLALAGIAAAATEGGPAHNAAAPQLIKLAVTGEGFVPAEVQVKKDVPVKLEVTRKTNRTCATELVIKDKNIRLELPLDKTVSVTFTPDKAGRLRYACGMDMVSGVLVVN